jgi:hypothetical protein
MERYSNTMASFHSRSAPQLTNNFFDVFVYNMLPNNSHVYVYSHSWFTDTLINPNPSKILFRIHFNHLHKLYNITGS